MLSKTSQSQKYKYCMIPFHEKIYLKLSKIIETKSRIVACFQGLQGGGNEDLLMGTEFQFYKMRKAMGMAAGDG